MAQAITRLDNLPAFLSSQDLVDLGIFPSIDSAYLARLRGISPDFFKVGRKVVYPKSSVEKFIQDRMQHGSGGISQDEFNESSTLKGT